MEEAPVGLGMPVQEFTKRLLDQASRKPTCPAAIMIAGGILEHIIQAPFDS